MRQETGMTKMLKLTSIKNEHGTFKAVKVTHYVIYTNSDLITVKTN